MSRRRGMTVTVVGALVLLVPVACGESTAIEGNARAATVVEQLVRELADPPAEPEALPVVYVVGVDGTIDIEVQAGVVAALVDEIDVRFADERIEAIDEGLDDLPVRDAGVLLVVQDVPPDGRVIDLEVERYETLDDWRRYVVSLRYREPDWVVTSTSVPDPVGT